MSLDQSTSVSPQTDSRRPGRRWLIASVVLFVISRLYTALFFPPPSYSDVTAVYATYALQGVDFGMAPYRNFKVEYPPVAWWTIAVPRWVDSDRLPAEKWRALPESRQAELVYAAAARYHSFFHGLALLLDVAGFALFVAIVRRSAPSLAGILAFGYVIALALLAPLLYERLDVGLLFLLLLWAYAWRRSLEPAARCEAWRIGSYVVLGLSVSFKVIPILMAPFLLLAELNSPRRWAALRKATVALITGAALPYLVQFPVSGPEMFDLFAHHAGRGIQVESVYANVLMAAAYWGLPIRPELTGGAWEIMSTASPLMKTVATATLLGFLASAGGFALWLRRRYDRLRAYATSCGVVAAAVILSNVLSPQYFIWAFPLILLVAADLPGMSRGRAATVVVVLAAIAALTTWIFPYHYFGAAASPGNSGALGLIPDLPTAVCAVLALRNVGYLALVSWLLTRLAKALVNAPVAEYAEPSVERSQRAAPAVEPTADAPCVSGVTRSRLDRVVVLVAVAAIILGVWFRLTNLDKKFYWQDEAYTSICLSGHTLDDLDRLVFDGGVHRTGELEPFQRVHAEQPLTSTVQALAECDVGHPPLYYGLLRIWAQLCGDSPATLRAFSALLSLLALPAIYWLCMELFHSRTTAWMATALWSVCPFQVLYAQEARQYSLWAVLAIVCSACLLRALRMRSTSAWALYALAVMAGMYTHLLFALVIAAHAAFVTISTVRQLREPATRRLWAQYAIAVSLAGLAFVPWLVVVLTHLDVIGRNNEYSAATIPLVQLAVGWVDNLSCLFADFGEAKLRFGAAAVVLTRLAPLVIAVSSLVVLCRRRVGTSWLFVCLLALVPALVLIVPDLCNGGFRSKLTRYWVPTFVGVELAVAYALSGGLMAQGARRRAVAGTLALLLLASSVASCAVCSQATIWWNKGGEANQIIDAVFADVRGGLATAGRAPRSLLVIENTWKNKSNLLAFSRLLPPETEFLVLRDPAKLALPAEREIYVSAPSPSLLNQLAKNGWNPRPLGPYRTFWRVTVKAPSVATAP